MYQLCFNRNRVRFFKMQRMLISFILLVKLLSQLFEQIKTAQLVFSCTYYGIYIYIR